MNPDKLKNIVKFYQEPGFVYPESRNMQLAKRFLQFGSQEFYDEVGSGITGDEPNVVDILREEGISVPNVTKPAYNKGGLATPKRGLVDGPGSYRGKRAIPDKYIDGILQMENLDGKKSYYARVRIGGVDKSFSDSSLEKVKKWKKKNSAIARKKGYEGRDMSYSAKQTKKQRAKEAKKTATARANINKWTKNWLDKNLNKYGVRELDLFKKELVEDWAKELKKNPKPYIGKFDFKPTSFQERTMTIKDLPNLTGSSISDKPFKYGPRVVGDAATIETTLNKIFYDNKLKDNNFKNKVKNFMQHYVDGKPHGNNVVARKAYDSKTAKLLDDDVLYFLSRVDSGLEGFSRQAVMETGFGNLWRNYRNVVGKMSANYQETSKLIDEFLGGKNIIAKASVREHDALRKIFDVSELPLSLRYNIDHMYGISEASREIKSANPSKARVRAILNNTLGMTQKRNFMLGTEGYSFKRKDLINKINAGKNVDANLLKLNEATKAAYNVDNAYEIKKGKATPGKSFIGQTRPERFKSYFEDIYKTPQGKKEIIRQKGSLKTLLEQLCPNKASGGRVGMKVAGSAGVACGANRFKQVFKNPNKGTQTERQLVAKVLKTSSSTAGRRVLNALGPAGIGMDALIEGAVWGDEVLTGASGKQAYNNLWISYLDPKAYTGGLKVSGDRYNETEMAKKYGGDTAKFYRLSHAIEDKYRLQNKLQVNEETDAEQIGITLTPNQRNRLKEVNKIIENAGGDEKVYSLLKEDSPLFNAAQISSERFEEVGSGKDLDRRFLARGPLAQRTRDERRKKEMEAYPTYDMFITPSEYKAMDLEQQQEAKNVIPELNLTERADIKNRLNIPTSDNLSEYVYPGSGISVLDEENLRKKWENLINTKGMRGTQDTRYAGGGIADVRRPSAIAPESGPTPQGEGLSYLFNRVTDL